VVRAIRMTKNLREMLKVMRKKKIRRKRRKVKRVKNNLPKKSGACIR
jgi:hypothetical protein